MPGWLDRTRQAAGNLLQTSVRFACRADRCVTPGYLKVWCVVADAKRRFSVPTALGIDASVP